MFFESGFDFAPRLAARFLENIFKGRKKAVKHGCSYVQGPQCQVARDLRPSSTLRNGIPWSHCGMRKTSSKACDPHRFLDRRCGAEDTCGNPSYAWPAELGVEQCAHHPRCGFSQIKTHSFLSSPPSPTIAMPQQCQGMLTPGSSQPPPPPIQHQ